MFEKKLVFALALGGLSTMLHTKDGTLPVPFDQNWNEAIGLWRGSTRHADGHDIRNSAARLVRAGAMKMLSQLPAERVLVNLLQAQDKKIRMRGNFWWSWEDRKVTDTNSGFFTTIQLLALHHEYREQLSAKAQRDLDTMLTEATYWFEHKVLPVIPVKLRYPNAYLGDAVCLWLLDEKNGRSRTGYAQEFSRILRYYRDEDWGWGEHLSDMYCKICQRILTALLMWNKKLDTESVQLAQQLMQQLLQLDNDFYGGPRVPTIRCYWLDKSPRTPNNWPVWFKPYRELMNAEEPLGEFTIAHLAAKRGLYSNVSTEPTAFGKRSIDCYGGRKAYSWVDRNWRLGVMSEYPLFKDTNSNAAYGLHWQSMPVAFWHRSGDWAYLQWVTEDSGRDRAMPAFSQKDGRSRMLSDKDANARYGSTYGLQFEKSFMVFRRLPVGSGWPWAMDRLRLIDLAKVTPEFDSVNGWHRATLRYEEETLTIVCRDLMGELKPELQKTDKEWTWGFKVPLMQQGRPKQLSFLWYLHVGDAQVTPPAIKIEAQATSIEWGEMRWLLQMDRSQPWSALDKASAER